MITGHTGFKGSWLSLWLSELGAQVYGLSIDIPTNPSHFASARLHERVEDSRIDIRNLEAVKAHIKKVKPEYIFHLAAQPLVIKAYNDPVTTWQTNTMGTINMLESLRSIDYKCVAVFITSDKCYENSEWVWGYRETDRIWGRDPYSASKGSAELAISSYVKSFFPQDGPVRIGVGRAGNVIGGGDWSENRIIPDCIRAISNNKLVKIRNPNSTRPWQHVLEPLSGYLELALNLNSNNKLHGEAFNFATLQSSNHTVSQLLQSMSYYWSNVKWAESTVTKELPHESQLLSLNCDKAMALMQWRSIWDFETTLKNTVHWYRSYFENPESDMQSISLSNINDYVVASNLSEL